MADHPAHPRNTTPRPGEPRLRPSRIEPTRLFERALAIALIILGLAMFVRSLV